MMLGETKVFTYRAMGINEKKRFYEGIAVPIALNGAETEV